MTTSSPLHHEWTALQQDHERHERCAIGIKLAAVVLAVICTLYAFPIELAAPLAGVVWVTEAMLRTVQARLGARLLKIEAMIADGDSPHAAFRLHLEWQASRPGAAGLLAEYAQAALKPTVAFPHAVLLMMLCALAWSGH